VWTAPKALPLSNAAPLRRARVLAEDDEADERLYEDREAEAEAEADLESPEGRQAARDEAARHVQRVGAPGAEPPHAVRGAQPGAQPLSTTADFAVPRGGGGGARGASPAGGSPMAAQGHSRHVTFAPVPGPTGARSEDAVPTQPDTVFAGAAAAAVLIEQLASPPPPQQQQDGAPARPLPTAPAFGSPLGHSTLGLQPVRTSLPAPSPDRGSSSEPEALAAGGGAASFQQLLASHAEAEARLRASREAFLNGRPPIERQSASPRSPAAAAAAAERVSAGGSAERSASARTRVGSEPRSGDASGGAAGSNGGSGLSSPGLGRRHVAEVPADVPVAPDDQV
jgi:hypothetical protein